MKTFKKILVVVLFVLFNSVLFAQSETKSANVIKQRLDSTINIANGSKNEYFYNNLGHNISSINYAWSNTVMKYEKSSKKEFAYNLKGYCNLIQTYIWDKTLSQWQLRDKVEQSYDENNQLLLTNSFIWNKIDSKWDYTNKSDYENSYNTNNKLVSTIIYSNSINATALNKTKFEYVYNSDGKITSVIHYGWVSYAWKQDNSEVFSYNVDGNMTNSGGFELKYNNTYAINQLLIPLYYFPHWSIIPTDFNVNHMITSFATSDGGTTRYYYSTMEVTGLFFQEALKTTVFPNPATDFLNIQWNGNISVLKVEVIDITGKKVFDRMIGNNSKIPIQGYPEGLYLVRILDSNKTVKTEKVYFK
ncbi:MAG TPA: hypothetical protein DCR40_15745 [Prolixibacteraceae bacterium]|nr:hypothetical protein [Prolixibacteraceae bacterium]